MNRQTKEYMEAAEDELYDWVLRKIDNIPRQVRTAADTWWIAVLERRLEEGDY